MQVKNKKSGSAVRVGLIAAFGLLAACSQEVPKHLEPLAFSTMARLEARGMDQGSPIMMRIFKQESELEIWKLSASGQYEHFKTYPICKWSGVLGPKFAEGDRQAPEGFYPIRQGQMNPWSNYYLSFNMGYPNRFDRAYNRTGSNLMVHGACSSAGCYSMTDEVIAEIYALAREAFVGGQEAFQVQAFPFRMTDDNMASYSDHEYYSFWENLKEGYDAFEQTRFPPKVTVCGKRYIFNTEFDVEEDRIDPVRNCPEGRPIRFNQWASGDYNVAPNDATGNNPPLPQYTPIAPGQNSGSVLPPGQQYSTVPGGNQS